jgi:hypothetical protein
VSSSGSTLSKAEVPPAARRGWKVFNRESRVGYAHGCCDWIGDGGWKGGCGSSRAWGWNVVVNAKRGREEAEEALRLVRETGGSGVVVLAGVATGEGV